MNLFARFEVFSIYETAVYQLSFNRLDHKASWNDFQRCGTIELIVPIKGRARFLKRLGGLVERFGFQQGEK